MTLTRAERRVLQQPDGIVRLWWKRQWQRFRIIARAEVALAAADRANRAAGCR